MYGERSEAAQGTAQKSFMIFGMAFFLVKEKTRGQKNRQRFF